MSTTTERTANLIWRPTLELRWRGHRSTSAYPRILEQKFVGEGWQFGRAVIEEEWRQIPVVI